MKPEDRIEQLIDEVLISVEKGADDATRILVADLSKFLDTLTISGGAFVMDDIVATQLTQINTVIASAINKSQYPRAVAEVVRSLDEITRLSEEVLKNYNPSIKIDFDKMGVSQLRIAQVETIVNNMTGDALTVNVRNGIRQGIQRNVFAGAKLTDTKNFIREYLEKQPNQKYARLTRYAHVYAQDGIMQYDGMIYDRFRQEFEITHVQYIGSLISDSRPQCNRWINKYDGKIPIDKLPAEIKWAETNGSGMNPATTPASFSTYRGGYACRHKAIPIAITEDE